MTLTEHALFAHVEQGQLIAVIEHLFQLGRAIGLCHGTVSLLSAAVFKLNIAIGLCPARVLRDRCEVV